MQKIRLTIVVAILLFSFTTSAQVAVSGFTDLAFGFNTNKEKKVSFEMKVFANNYLDVLPFEASVFYNFPTKEYHRFSLGLGLNFSPFISEVNAIVVPAALEIFPIKEFKKIAVVFEVAPMILNGDDTAVRGLIGIRYSFDKR
jgi:hypothetical protein|nr:hypothetical protein [uncultured Flavobacterium sp.]